MNYFTAKLFLHDHSFELYIFFFLEWIHLLQIAPFDPTKKKKKKKVIIQDPADDSVENLAEQTENLSGIYIE